VYSSNLLSAAAAASIFWILYGVVIHATPIIVANVIVATLAIFSALRGPEVAKPAPAE